MGDLRGVFSADYRGIFTLIFGGIFPGGSQSSFPAPAGFYLSDHDDAEGGADDFFCHHAADLGGKSGSDSIPVFSDRASADIYQHAVGIERRGSESSGDLQRVRFFPLVPFSLCIPAGIYAVCAQQL